jgi:hypothetical protein
VPALRDNAGIAADSQLAMATLERGSDERASFLPSAGGTSAVIPLADGKMPRSAVALRALNVQEFHQSAHRA